MATTKIIPLTALNVNTENYRFEPVASQKEAIDKMIENQGDKLYNLAEDIAKNGLNLSDRVQVAPSDHDTTKFNVLEGNRRIAALKLLSNPEIIDNPAKSHLKNKFRKLRSEHKSRLIQDIECAVYNTPAEADKWIKLKHTGENNGVGTVTWNAYQVARFEEKEGGKSSNALQTIKILQNSPYVSTALKDSLRELNTSNLNRLISDPQVREFLGIEINNGLIQSSTSEEEVIKGLIQIVTDLTAPSFNVRKIYTKQDREDYLKHFSPDSKPDTTVKAAKPWQTPSVVQTNKHPVSSKIYPTYRRVLIPKKCVLNIPSFPKVNKIYHELQGINVDKFVNATAVLFRVFVELSCDCYLEHHKLLKGAITAAKSGMDLKQKVLKVAENLELQKFADRAICKGVRTEVKDSDGILGIDTFHAYIHNNRFSPASKNLIIAWDNIEEFMKKVWENIK